jgi:polysaccharide export outer membrane protein
LEEMKDVTSARVSGDGMIELPLVGPVRASGLDEEGLRTEIRHRLEAHYMYDPQVNLFVREYRSRQVAVVGAVERPGLYNLASEADTILDMIAQAGGMKQEAAPRLQFIPAEPVEGEQAKELASAVPVQLASKDPVPLILKKGEPIVIDLKSVTKSDNRLFLSLPVRPGDVIMVPGTGDVLVEGWVEKPGSYTITPGLTAVGAVAAAGGAMFVANTASVKIIRMGNGGTKTFFLANLDQIKRGEKPDIPVLEGDVIEVSPSALKAVPYGLYTVFTSMFRVGAYLY